MDQTKIDNSTRASGKRRIVTSQLAVVAANVEENIFLGSPIRSEFCG